MTSIEDIKNKLTDDDANVRKEACEELANFPDSVTDLINMFTDKNPHVRFQAAKSLAQIGNTAIKPLISALNEDNTQVQKYVILSLKDIGDSAVGKELINALESEDFAIRKFSAKALGDMCVKEAVDPLINLLKDDDWGVMTASTKALGDIGDKSAIDPIKKARRAATGDKDYKKVANKALKKIDPKPKKKKTKK